MEEWDAWTAGNFAGREAQVRVSMDDRAATLRGRDSQQFQEYMRAMAQRDARR
jgi:hypothetical protein